MIKIQSYKDHPLGIRIYHRYLYLAALSLPFSPEDVLDNERLFLDGKVIDKDNFLDVSKKKTRHMGKKVRDALKKYGISGTHPPFVVEQLLASKIIYQANKKLYEYLYDKNNILPIGIPPIKRENLRTLLIVPMDKLDKELDEIGVISAVFKDDLLDYVFRYKYFSRRKETALLLEDMGVNVCPYCNRIYTVTLTKNGQKSRPQFDHYKSKKKYPYFAVSLMNLIPSCGLCNLAKGDKDEEVLYPYSDEMGTDFMFRAKAKKGLNHLMGISTALDEFDISLDIMNPNIDTGVKKKGENSEKTFHLKELYRKHKDYVLDLFKMNYVFSDEYLQSIYSQFSNMFNSYEEVRNLLYLKSLDKSQWGKQSLAKLTHDINWQIQEERGASFYEKNRRY